MTSTSTAQEAGVSVPPPRENLYRINPDIGLTRADGAAMPTMTGHFAVWDQWTEIRSAFEGNFMERFAPTAMNKTLSENTPKVLFQHGKDPAVGEKVLGPVSRVEPDATGAFYEVPLLDTSYNRDLVPGLQAGLYGASFRFSVLQEEFLQRPKRSDMNPRGIPERTVTEARVMEFGPVTFPAYAGSTAGIRSITDEFLLERLLTDDRLSEQLAKKAADKNRVSVFFSNDAEPKVTVEPAHTKRFTFAAEERVDSEDLGTLACMLQSGAQYIADQDEADDQGNVPKMEAILASIAQLVPVEAQENEPPMEGELSESEPPGATTRINPGIEPEPSAATTRVVTPNQGLYTNREEKPAWLL